MTNQGTNPTWREVETDRGPMAVGVSQHGLLIREKGRRTTFGPIPFTALYDLGAKYEAGVVGKTTPKRKRITRGLIRSDSR